MIASTGGLVSCAFAQRNSRQTDPVRRFFYAHKKNSEHTVLAEETMSLETVLRGMILGFSIAAPVGPIGVLCIRRTLADGRRYAFVSGLGAATADAFYGCVAGFGLTLVSDLLLAHQIWLRLIGGLYLCYLGLHTFWSRPAEHGAEGRAANLLSAYTSTLLLTITNPMTIFTFMALFAGIAATGQSYTAAGALVLGVFTGSALWWLLLSGGVGLFRSRLDLRRLRWVNQGSGLIIAGFGALALLSLWR
jgi:threonine/homoserine/homoserine lactone efflux protein